VRLRRLDQKLMAGIVGLFLLPALLTAGILIALYRWGAFHDALALLVTVVVGLAALMAYLGLMAHAIGQNLVQAIRHLQLGTELIATVNPEHRLSVATGDELQRLAEEINHLADRLTAAHQDGVRAAAGAASELEAERTRLARVLDALGEAVIVVSPEGRIGLGNRAAQVLLGESLVGRELGDVVAGAATLLHAADEFRAGARGARRLTVPRGGDRLLDAVVSPLREGEGRLTGLVIILRDRAADGDERAGSEALPRSRGAGFVSGVALGGPPPRAHPDFYDFSVLDEVERHVSMADRSRLLGGLACTVLDVETTGLDPARGDRIVSIACVRIRNGVVRPAEMLDVLVNPGRPLPPASTRIHGITEEMVAGAPPLEAVLPEILSFALGTVLVGHHVWFDLGFLRAAMDRLALRPLTDTHPVLDTRLLSQIVHRSLARHDLETVCVRLGVAPRARHSALGDALATAEIFPRLVELLRRRGIETLGQALDGIRGLRRQLPSA
jgi:DNA polymerase III epsilon subunit family exonuclease